MNRLLCSTVIVLLAVSLAMAQRDSHGNPVFHSEQFESNTLEGCTVDFSYYTINDNIDNPKSSVYVADHPTLAQFEFFARSLPSYFAIVARESVCVHLVVQACRIKKGKVVYSYLVIDPVSKKSVELPSRLGGDLTEFRAAELISGEYDSKATFKTRGSELFVHFNGSEHLVQAFEDVRSEVLDLVRKHNLRDPNIDLDRLRR